MAEIYLKLCIAKFGTIDFKVKSKLQYWGSKVQKEIFKNILKHKISLYPYHIGSFSKIRGLQFG